MYKSFPLSVALALGVTACGHLKPIGQADRQGAASAIAPAPGDPGFRFGAGDEFEVRVYREPELSGTYMVGSQGSIQFPLTGSLGVAGLTAEEIASEITRSLKEGYLRDPQVTVLLKDVQSRKVSVLGQVSKPGTFTYQERLTIVEAVSLAGGLSKLADRRRGKGTRKRDGQEQTFVLDLGRVLEGQATNLVLRSGDVVFAPESLF